MSHPDQPQSQPQRQAKAEREAQSGVLLRWVGAKLLQSAPPEWRRLDLKVIMASTVDDFTYTTIMKDGSALPYEMPVEVRRAFVDIRDLLYEPDLGTWFSVRFTMDPPDEYHVDFNFDVDPVWDPPVAPEILARDLEAFPRSVENTPGWLGIAPPAPSQSMGYDQQSKQVKLIGDQLIHTLPAGWDYAQVHFREVGDHTETNALVHNVAGRMEPWTPPQPVADLFHELREGTRDTPDGAWYSSRFEIKHKGEQKLHMNRSDEPQWINPPPREAYEEELRRSGGGPDAVPDWLRAKL